MSYTVTGAEQAYSLNEPERVKAILQNISLILATAQGTVPLYRDFGLPTDALDLPLPAAKAKLTVAIKEAVETYEPRAEIIRISFDETGGIAGRLCPILEVNIADEES